MIGLDSLSIELHKKLKGKLSITSKIPVSSQKDLALLYTPGVAEPCKEIAADHSKVYDYTGKGNMVAVITDGTAVLGLGNIGAEASLPVMEGKSLLMKEFAGLDSFPIALNTQDPAEVVKIITAISPVFGAINLEDISAPNCFEIENKLENLGIPVMHDDQHGTVVVILAALLNALKVVKKDISKIKVVINGVGAAGSAICKQLSCIGYDKRMCTRVKEILLVDSKGIIFEGRSDLSGYKNELAKITNRSKISGYLQDALKEADVFIGLSRGNLLTKEMVQSMGKDAIVFAMANPVPEIMPDEALKGGAAVIGTGRSDFPNQINNVLAFPGIFRGALDARATKITPQMRMAAALALSDCVPNPTKDFIVPSPLDKSVATKVAAAVMETAIAEGVIRE